ncbi:MAG: hypothetical protein ABI036_14475 [Fibrobacteria bacterium]
MLILNWLGITLSSAAYLSGLRLWIYRGRLLFGLLATLICFPVLICLTTTFPAAYLRAMPLVGIGMFIHHYGSRLLMQIKLLWFTTLSVLVVQGYFFAYAHFAH